MADIRDFKSGQKIHDTGPDDVLESAKDRFNDVLVIGWDKEDNLVVFSSAGLTKETDINLIVDIFKAKLIRGDYSGRNL